jgi:hypothetical protein
VTDLLAPPAPQAEVHEHGIVVLENVRGVSTSRSIGLGITIVVLAIIELAKFALLTTGTLETTIQFTYDNANAIPSLSTVMQVVVGVLGGVAIVGGIVLIARRWLRSLGISLAVVGTFLVAWPIAL